MGSATRILRGLALAAGMLLLLERACWLALPPLEREPMYQEHPVRFWALRPGSSGWDDRALEDIPVNSLGLRGAELDLASDAPRVLLLGDSVLYAPWVRSADGFETVLPEEIRRHTGVEALVANGGVPGYSTYQGLDLLREVGPRLRPDVVVLAYLFADRRLDVEEDAHRHPGGLAAALRPLLWRSSIYSWLRIQLAGEYRHRGGLPELSQHPDGVQRVPPADYEANLRTLASEARALGARSLIFLLLPTREATPDAGQAHEVALRRVGAREGLLLDLDERWKREGRNDPACYLDELHLTPEGVRRVSADLAEFMRDHGMLERP